ncbi:MAG: hypothetical protein ABJH05_18305 [Fulvivirga sp.]
MKILYYTLLLPISLLPFWALYLLSDFMYLLLYKVAGYRRKVVNTNISKSFPSLSKKEVLQIEKEFFRHFFDIIVEAIKAFTISKAQVEKRFVHYNTDIFEKYKGQHITLVGGHNGNWELYAVSIGMHMIHKPVALYTPLSNKFINEKILKSRSKYGLMMQAYKEVKALIQQADTEPLAVIFGSDQCPKLTQKPYFMEFLNQETAVQFGTEKFACDYNTPVIYGVIKKLKRGHYAADYRLVTDAPRDLPFGEITEKHTRMLEEDINKAPAYWLWTHKRWKRTKKDFEAYAAKQENEVM